MDTAKHICDEITANIICVQPLHIEPTAYESLVTQDPASTGAILSQIQQYKHPLPNWLLEFNKLNNIYKKLAFFPITSDQSHETLLPEASKEVKKLFSNHENRFNAYILFDPQLLYFVLVYDIYLHGSYQLFDQAISGNELSKNIYNNVRSALVMDNPDSTISAWGNQTRKAALEAVNILISANTRNWDPKNLRITTNSGNITFIINTSKISQESSQALAKKFFSSNRLAERLESNEKAIDLANGGELLFNGRHHTIIIRSEKDTFRYIPIQFNIQFTWFYLIEINELIEESQNRIAAGKISNTEIEILDAIINKVELLQIHDAKFKFAIESDNKSIYEHIEETWNINPMLLQTKTYISYLNEYLTRIFQKKSAKADTIQNNILFLISLIQIIALISVWNDYISASGSKLTEETSFLIKVFGSESSFHLFNAYLPIYVGVITALLLILKIISDRNQK